MINSKTERTRRRLKKLNAFKSWAFQVFTHAMGFVVAVGILWIIQVGVTSI